ncbi:Oxoglutarate and iron-dependent oxygenase degradation C-term-domain-containing protein [Sporodiniella umbellata]|nr:Oxoglutarate and iron-dependent oxygenase degradation C-term-domain-containing protein [Sporodiniella umbellata]
MSSKRVKLDKDHVHNKFHRELFSEASIEKIEGDFKASKPYLHCKIDQLMDQDLLVRVRKEILSNLHFTLKETDIYKVNQTGDLANLDGLPSQELEQLSSLFELRNAIYSDEFRGFISQVTDCGPLSAKMMDMSINSYQSGCHLLNHDDVIGTRRVSFILYLTDPQDPWQPRQGGALELYPVLTKGIPDNEPTVVIPPQWNQFVMFTVQPGHSFHSVEEVVGAGNRLSISGWFHIPQEGEPGYQPHSEAETKSSLEQLQEEPKDSVDRFQVYSEQAPLDLDASVMKELEAWIHPHYLNTQTLEGVLDKFLDESAVQCKAFLNDTQRDALAAATAACDAQDGMGRHGIVPHGTGVGEGWKVQGPPHRLRYMVHTESDTFFHRMHLFFASHAFRLWLKAITDLLPVGYRGETRRFRPGHDYTLATTNTRGQGVLDVTLCYVDKPTLWADGDFGGYECYMAPHEEEEDAAVYKAADEDGALLTLPAGQNELSIVLRDEGVMRFIKYISARAPGSRWDTAYEFDLPQGFDQED